MPKTATTKKNTKRPHLYGKGISIYFAEGQNRWMCSVKLEDGRRKYISGGVGASYEECEEKFKEGIQLAQQGTLIASNAQTLKEYLVCWLEEKKIALKKGTYPKWQNHLNVHVIPVLGSLKLKNLKREHFQALIVKMIKKGLAASTIRHIFRIVSSALKVAVNRCLLRSNPCEGVTLPRKEDKEMRFLDIKQARALLSSLCGHPHEVLFMLAVTTGMRRGELTGLRWEDIDFDKGVINVRRAVVQIPKEGYHESEPKSKASRRGIPLIPQALVALLQLREKQGGEAATGLVFHGMNGGYFSPRGIGWALGRILQDAGLPKIHFHGLRHTAATLMLRAGVSVSALQRILGHADIATTLKYVHLLPEEMEEGIKRLSNLLYAA